MQFPASFEEPLTYNLPQILVILRGYRESVLGRNGKSLCFPEWFAVVQELLATELFETVYSVFVSDFVHFGVREERRGLLTSGTVNM
jgi:hypothetical protein